MEQLFMGIDLGTSAIKFVLINKGGKVLAQLKKEYRTAQPSRGWNEIDPRLWLACMKEGVCELLDGFDGRQVARIGVTGQMHTLVIVDAAGNPIRPAIMWNDTRTKDLIPEMQEKMGQFPEGGYLSKTISTGSPAANLYWIKRHEAEHFNRIHKFLIGPDYLVACLTGQYGTDYCEASTSCLFQIKKKCWSPEMGALTGLRPGMYPDIRGSGVVAGTVKPGLAKELGISCKAQVIAGTGDNPATAISTGCLGYGYPVVSLGTSGVVVMPVAQIQDDAKGKVILFSFDGNKFSYLVQGVVQSTGSTVEWCLNHMGYKSYDEMDSQIDLNKGRQNDLLFYPHLMGDKTLYANPNIRGAFIGLGIETNRSDMAYGVLEGLSFSFLELMEKMKLPSSQYESIKVVGGGASSKAWMQLMANVLNIKIEQMDGMVGAAFGIALLAAGQQEHLDLLRQTSSDMVKVKASFLPDVQYTSVYRKKYDKYLRMNAALNYITQGTLR